MIFFFSLFQLFDCVDSVGFNINKNLGEHILVIVGNIFYPIKDIQN